MMWKYTALPPLPLWGQNVDRIAFDIDQYEERLSDDADRLCLSDEETCLQVLEAGASRTTRSTSHSLGRR